MDALLRINRHFGITVICNLHSLDTARVYCDRLVGMAQGRVVFDDVARDLYGLDAGEVMDTAGTALPLPAQGLRPSLAVA
jgi:phosphonate transport system ATP-binding protein